MQLEFMEHLLRLEAEAKYFLGATNRSYEQTLMDELLKIIEEVELLFGPRDRSYELLPPRITQCGCAHPYVLPFRKVRIYLTSDSKTRYVASYQLAHEAVHVLGPTQNWATVLEEGLATHFSHSYMKRVYGLHFDAPNRWYGAAMRAVAPLLAKNQFVIKDLRAREPQLSKIDETLLVEVAGVEREQAKILCADFESSWLTASNWNEYAVRGAQIFASGFRSFFRERKSGS
ncbi:MAG TPA: hypothetical protein VFR78_05705 [Pyrinomonadaceae bacterium]|nr:hypothetical protein [Pyrinomonadaceae bacterium]